MCCPLSLKCCIKDLTQQISLLDATLGLTDCLHIGRCIKKAENYDLAIIGNQFTDGDTGQAGASIVEFF